MPAPKPELYAIAEKLGISIRTLTNWRKREGFPRDGTAEAVKAWAEGQGLHRISDGSLGALKAEIMRRDIELRDLKISRERGDVIDREVVEEMLGLLAQKLDLLLRLKLEVELGPRVAGKSAAEANLEGTAILDEIREVVNANLARFGTEAVKESQRTDESAD
jgi:transcriptional regulator with XRE-family HTH domain